MDDDPVIFALKDPISIAMGGVIVLLILLAVF
jgi:hypothetical protein